MKQPDILAAIEPILNAFEKLKIAYYIGGSVASSAYGIARATIDVDMVADIKLEHTRPLMRMLESSFYIDEEMIINAIRNSTTFNVLHLETMIKADIFIIKDNAYSRKSFQRIRRDTLDDAQESKPVFLAAPEDIILNKIVWFRKGGEVSDRQWSDVMGVLKVQNTLLDMKYLRYWADHLGIDDLLERALNELIER